MNIRHLLLLTLAFGLAGQAEAAFNTSTFEDQSLAANSFRNDTSADPTMSSSGQFVSGGNSFNNTYTYNPTYGGLWSGWAISSKTDTATPGFMNQYSAITGTGAGGSQTYAVGFTSGNGSDPNHPDGSIVNLAAGTNPYSVQVTNTTYDYYSMLKGDQFAKKFGAGDFLKLTIAGYDSKDGLGSKVGEVDFYLANFLGTDPTRYTIVNTWNTVDLSSLAGSASLRFGLESSDNGDFGINTPAYLAVDNFTAATTAVPEPASWLLCMSGIGIGALVLRRARTHSDPL